MEMRVARLAGLISLGALVAAPFVAAHSVDSFRIATDPDAAGYSRSLLVVIRSPFEYEAVLASQRDNGAAWRGPLYWAPLDLSQNGATTLEWTADVSGGAETAAAVGLTHRWPVVAQGTEPIERTLSGRIVGTVPATWVLSQASVAEGEARYEAALALPLCGRTAVLSIAALQPASDSAGNPAAGDVLVRGLVKPTVWNREKVLETITGVSLEGTLPSSRVSADRRGRALTGRVSDCNGQAVPAAAVRLQRRSGSRWLRVGVGRADGAGKYSLHVPGPGMYRVAAGVARSARVVVP